jgi:hypothetical protein
MALKSQIDVAAIASFSASCGHITCCNPFNDLAEKLLSGLLCEYLIANSIWSETFISA